MTRYPATHYVKTADDVHIAYQVFGEGPDLLYCIGLWWHLEYQWEIPSMRRHLERLGRIRRVVLFDKRGTGLSDRVPPQRLVALDDRLHDLRAVLDAVGSERTAVLGRSYSADVAIAFAALHPERTDALILIDGYARLLRSDDHPWGLTDRQALAALEQMDQHWDEPQGFGRRTGFGDDLQRERWMTMQRLAVSPGAAVALWRTAQASDVRPLLGQIRAPTLVVHHDPNRLVDVGCGRYLAAAIPQARLQLVAGYTAVFDEDLDELIAIEQFLTGRASAVEPERVLTTVLFTDIVDSTARAVDIGDRRWRTLLDEHDRIVDRALERHSGRKVNATGDGILASFGAPARAIRCAADLREDLESIGLEIRAGIHTGEVETRGDDLGGIAVNIGARVAGLAGPGQILVTRTVTDLVAGSDIVFEDHGDCDLKGVPGSWHLFAARVRE